ncbi:hypothetical protein SNEBB_006954 [Seison nebaliae]|nr:hypothetical protein SNEBB_006954 [Seison nebaliae]
MDEDMSENLHSPIKDLNEKWKLVPLFIEAKGVVRQHLDSYNYFVEHGMKQIMKTNNLVTCTNDTDWYVKYLDLYVEKPQTSEGLQMSRVISPNECRIRDLTYSAPVYVDIEYMRGSRCVIHKRLLLANIPVMLKSKICNLYRLKEEEMSEMNECPMDPGGYYIIRGTERVILIQEQMAKNRIIVEYDSKNKNSLICHVTSHSLQRKTKTTIVERKNCLYLVHNYFTETIPIFVLFRAMNILSDLEILSMISFDIMNEDDKMTKSNGYNEAKQLLLNSIDECHRLKVFTEEEALVYINKRLKQSNFFDSLTSSTNDDTEIELAQLIDNNSHLSYLMGSYGDNRHLRNQLKKEELNYQKKLSETRETISNMILSHIPSNSSTSSYKNMNNKCVYLGYMIKRLLTVKCNLMKSDDRDYYGIKRIEMDGTLLLLLFEDSFKRFNYELRVIANRLINRTSAKIFDAVNAFSSDVITKSLTTAIGTGNWNIKRFHMERSGVTHVLSRLSYIAALGMMTRISSQFEKTRKVSGPRSLQPSQWGMLCPSDTPEGEACGLVKNLALMTHVTTDLVSNKPLYRFLINCGVEPLELMIGNECLMKDIYTVLLDGELIGWLNHEMLAMKFVRKLRRLRRLGCLNSHFISICLSKTIRLISISTDSGRLCRPYVVVDERDGSIRLKQHHLESIGRNEIDWNSLIEMNILEYLDVNEESDSEIAINSSDILPHFTTHLEIEPFTLLGICGGLIPYPDHNQSPRNTYQCAMGKQAMGIIGYNQQLRYDTILYLHAYPQKPMVKTRTIEIINWEKVAAGQNAIVAVMSYSGYDIEDALIINKASIDRGYGRCLVNRRYSTSLRSFGNNISSDRIKGPLLDMKTGKFIHKHAALDNEGIAHPASIVTNKQVLVNKVIPKLNNNNNSKEVEFQEVPLVYSNFVPAIVDRVMLTSTANDPLLVKINMLQVRRPELGDKFSSRHGQKGVTGLIISQEDMPFTDLGVCPDVIMNPHGYPSRMTVGKLMELLGSKAGVLEGKFHYGTVFSGDSVKDLSDVLIHHDFNYMGKDFVYSGVTGDPLSVYIYFGPIYYQKLKHMVQDKIHARSRGPRAMLTRQPTEGRSRDGGLRLGEMERDCLIGYGASLLLLERLMISSDQFTVELCNGCGIMSGINYCNLCQTADKMASLSMPYACKLLFQELHSMNIVPRLKLKSSI